jgi:tRNA 2-thiocytidine biosynthesis protein TtcA
MHRPHPLERRLSRDFARAIRAFDMIRENDRILVAMSGGKDSYVLLELLHRFVRRAPFRISLVPVHIDQQLPKHNPKPLIDYLQANNHPIHVEVDDIYAAVQAKVPPGKSPCPLCSRLRRAVLYRLADELGCTKIALGHHRDDAIVTFLLNLVFSGQLKSMPPKLVSDDGKHVVIRPLIYCSQDVIASFAHVLGCPILPTPFCRSIENQQRDAIDQLLSNFEERHPGTRQSMLAALANVRPSHLLDPGLWHALGLQVASDEHMPSDDSMASP